MNHIANKKASLKVLKTFGASTHNKMVMTTYLRPPHNDIEMISSMQSAKSVRNFRFFLSVTSVLISRFTGAKRF